MKKIYYKLIEVFSIVFQDFFPSFHNSSCSKAAGRPEYSGTFFITDIEIIVFKSFKLIRTYSNGYNIFTIRLTNNFMYISTYFPFCETKQKANMLFIVLNIIIKMLISVACHA